MDKLIHKIFKDDRGSYTPISTTELGLKWDQCSVSINEKPYTFRGLHYQTNPSQTKYIKVVQGSMIDFTVDLTTGKTEHITLNDSEAVLIPSDKAHGFLTLEPNTIVCYLVEGTYNPDSEHSIVWDTNKTVKKVIESIVGDHPLIISHKDSEGK